MPRTRTCQLVIVTGGLFFSLFMTGCGGSGAGSTRMSRLDTAIAAYDRGDFEAAERHAEAVEGSEAIYLAGIASMRQGSLDDADRKLLLVRDDAVVGERATDALGIIAALRGEPAPAVAYRPGAHRDAGASRQIASSGQFALQIGAFSSERRAQAQMRDVAGLGRGSRIIERHDAARGHLYIVQIGSFASRSDAAAFRNRHGQRSWMVVTHRDR